MTTPKLINNIGLCLALMASAAACSTDNTDIPTPPLTLTLDCGIGAKVNQPGTRATVDYGNLSEDGENFKWNTADTFSAYLCTTGDAWDLTTPATFTIDPAYMDKSSNKASFTGSFATAGTYRLLALYPANPAVPASPIFTPDGSEPGKFSFKLSATLQTQPNKKNEHLKSYMLMWAKTTAPVTVTSVAANNTAPGIGFHHLTTMLRFTITNKSKSAYRVTQISITATGTDDAAKVFGTAGSIAQNASSWTTAPVITYDADRRTNTVALRTKNLEVQGIRIGIPEDEDNILHAYLLALPGADLTDRKLTFALTVTDEDGTHEHTYLSSEFDANRILNDPTNTANAKTWQAGMRYWFDIDLNDALTVTGTTITPWDESTGNVDLGVDN